MKSVLDFIKLYWGYFTTVLAIGTFVWTLGVKAERKTYENINIKDDVKELKVGQFDQKHQLDSVLTIVKSVKTDQEALRLNQNAMRRSYVQYLSKDKSLSKEDFINYMNGLEFQLMPIEKSFEKKDDKQEYNIKINKINPEENER